MIFSKNINKQSYLELLLEVYITTLGIDARSTILIEMLNLDRSDQEFIKQYFEDRDFFQVNFLIKNFEMCQKIFSSTKQTEIFFFLYILNNVALFFVMNMSR